MSRNPRISLCMIVRDEQECLLRCLESAKPFVDEMIIVDTGSTDDTVAIAESFGAKVVHQPWMDDFSAARNRSIAEATGDWILALDADETLSPEAGRDLQLHAGNPEMLCASFDMRCAEADGQESVVSMVRAWRRRDDVRYRYRIHEQILPDLWQVIKAEGLKKTHCRGEIYHEGYLPEIVEARGKEQRNLRIFALQLEETPDDLYILYKYSDYMRRFPEYSDRVVELLERAYSIMQTLPEADLKRLTYSGQITAILGEILQRDGQIDHAWDVTSFGLEHCQETPDLLYIHGKTALLRNDGVAAEVAFTKCRSYEGRTAVVAVMPHITGVGAVMGLARARFLQGKKEEACATAKTAMESNPDSESALILWAELQTECGLWGPTFQRVTEVITAKPEWSPAWFLGGELLTRMKLYDKALPLLQRAEELGQQNPNLPVSLGQCYLAAGMIEKSSTAFEAGLPFVGCKAGLVAIHILCHIDPDYALNPDDMELLGACRSTLDIIRETEEHPFMSQLESAGDWIATSETKNSGFLELALQPSGNTSTP